MKIRDLYLFVIDTNLAESAFSKYDSVKNLKVNLILGQIYKQLLIKTKFVILSDTF